MSTLRRAVAGPRAGVGGLGRAAPALALWLAAMLATPFVEAAGGVASRPVWIPLTVALQVLFVLLLVAPSVGGRGLIRLVLPVLAIAFVAEAIGAATDLPFGGYAYTDLLVPQLLGVPLVIPFAWLMLLPSAWAVGRAIAGRWEGPRFVVASAVALTAWDLFLDPQMVAWGVWRWDEPGAYFGIPLLNFAGWLLVAALITLAARPRDLPRRPLLAFYVLVAAIETVGLLQFWGLAGPALAGALGMGTVAALAWRAELREADR
jgi:putative membrane protein